VRHDLPTGTVTFLFTDVEGSTRLLEELGAAGYAEALEQHRRVIRGALAGHGGVEVDTQGDAFFCAFASAGDAVAAAGAIRDGLTGGRIQVRIGVHTGEALLAYGHYVGMDVHRAARIGAVGHGGQVVLSPTTVALLAPGAAELVDLGEHRLKDLSAPVRLRQLGAREFPPLKTLYRTNLPVPATPFLGREEELQHLVELATLPSTRLLTLTGPGGSGKTRLALQLAGALADGRPGGVFWVPLAPLRDPELVAPEVARSLGVVPDAGLSLEEAIAERLARSATLVLLDNCEHLLAGVAAVVAPLLAAVPSLLVLATSREPLGVVGEREAPVEPMRADDAVELFVERARAIRPGFEPDATVERIVERLDRLPLAVELAAARIRALSAHALLERLDQALPLLTGGPRDADERQRTLRAAIAWSVDLLDDEERRLLARLSVFAGGGRLDAVAGVADGDLDVLESLVAKSLVRVREDVDGELRYWLLETIREYSLEELESADEAAATRQRHSAWYAALIANVGPGLRDRRQPSALARFDDDRDNVRVALAHLETSGACEPIADAAWELLQYWDVRGLFDEAAGVAHRALAACAAAPARARARLLYCRGFFRDRIVEGDGANDYELAVPLFAEAGDADGEGIALAAIAFQLILAGDRNEAVELVRRASMLTADGDPWVHAWVENVRGSALCDAGLRDEGHRAHLRALEILEDLGDGFNAAILQLNLAETATATRDFETARKLLTATLRAMERLGAQEFVQIARTSLANVEVCAGRFEDAIPWLRISLDGDPPDPRGLAEVLLTTAIVAAAAGLEEAAVGAWAASERARGGRWRPTPSLVPVVDERLAPLRERLPGARFDELWERGSALASDAAYELARSTAAALDRA
jgi:predicted ATPase/class 3 adenylate cyclase